MEIAMKICWTILILGCFLICKAVEHSTFTSPLWKQDGTTAVEILRCIKGDKFNEADLRQYELACSVECDATVAYEEAQCPKLQVDVDFVLYHLKDKGLKYTNLDDVIEVLENPLQRNSILSLLGPVHDPTILDKSH